MIYYRRDLDLATEAAGELATIFAFASLAAAAALAAMNRFLASRRSLRRAFLRRTPKRKRAQVARALLAIRYPTMSAVNHPADSRASAGACPAPSTRRPALSGEGGAWASSLEQRTT